jgi:hypothetical protein
MKQQTLAMAAVQNVQYEQYRRPTKRDAFLATMEQIVPWAELCSVIEPYYPKAGNGRPPVGLQRMLRMYFVQHWFNLADAACEDALLDSTALRRLCVRGHRAGQHLPGAHAPCGMSAPAWRAGSSGTRETWPNPPGMHAESPIAALQRDWAKSAFNGVACSALP